jgi:Uma2 family endonuclease
MNPVILVEVLSEATEEYDRGDKFTLYKSISTLKHYILISQGEVLVDHFEKVQPDEWRLRSFRDRSDVVQISDPPLTLRLSEIFRRVL